jgi:hypothetical protein
MKSKDRKRRERGETRSDRHVTRIQLRHAIAANDAAQFDEPGITGRRFVPSQQAYTRTPGGWCL